MRGSAAGSAAPPSKKEGEEALVTPPPALLAREEYEELDALISRTFSSPSVRNTTTLPMPIPSPCSSSRAFSSSCPPASTPARAPAVPVRTWRPSGEKHALVSPLSEGSAEAVWSGFLRAFGFQTASERGRSGGGDGGEEGEDGGGGRKEREEGG